MSRAAEVRPQAKLIVLAVAGVLAAAATGAWWLWPGHAIGPVGSSGDGAGPGASEEPVSLIVSGDTAGWIVPCGCASNQSGGLLRRGSFVAAQRERSAVVVADAGGAPGGTSTYQRVKFEAILRGERAMDVAAHNLGGPEAKLGAAYLRRIRDEMDVPFVSANLRDAEGKRVAAPHRIVEAGGRRLLFVGVLSPRYAAEGLQVGDPQSAVLETLARVDEPYDVLVVLAYLPETELREFAAALPEADLVLGGPTGQSIPPTRAGPALLAAATNKGKFLVHLTLSGPEGASWSGRVVELSREFDDDRKQKENLQAYYGELARRDIKARETEFAPELPPALPDGYRVSGTRSCRQCHASDCRRWDESGHAHAWQTLQTGGAHVDSYCQQCHTTGFGLPGGFRSVRSSPERVSVGCESCHGPSRAHAVNPQRRTPFAAADQCVRCHDRENSPNFDYAVYWPKIRHGETQPSSGTSEADETLSPDEETEP